VQKGKGRKVRVKKDVKKEKNVRKDEAKKKKLPPSIALLLLVSSKTSPLTSKDTHPDPSRS